MRRRPSVPPSVEESERSFREEVEAFRREPWKEKLKIVGAALLFLPILALICLIAFFVGGGWALFDDRLPAWVERLFTGLVVVLIAWSLFRPLLDRLERRDERRPPK